MKENNTDNNVMPLTKEEKQLLFKNILNSIKDRERRKRKNQYAALAIILVLLISVGGFFRYENMRKPDVYFSATNETKINLDDGTEVTLLKGAKLIVEKSFPANTRDVYLEGDAFFKVAKSKEHPFIVHGKDYETKVLGTVFKVVQDKGAFHVDLFEGKVAVTKSSDKKEVYYLKPDQTFSNFGNLQVAAVVPTAKAATTKPAAKEALNIDLHFNGCSVKDAISVIEKTYDLKIDYPKDFAAKPISISLKNLPSAVVLQAIALSLDLKIKAYDNTYKLEE